MLGASAPIIRSPLPRTWTESYALTVSAENSGLFKHHRTGGWTKVTREHLGPRFYRWRPGDRVATGQSMC